MTPCFVQPTVQNFKTFCLLLYKTEESSESIQYKSWKTSERNASVIRIVDEMNNRLIAATRVFALAKLI